MIDWFAEIEEERDRQNDKWGPQCDKNTEGQWLAILVEEVGECANAMLHARPEDGGHPDWLEELRTELVQVAAVAVAWLECLDLEETE